MRNSDIVGYYETLCISRNNKGIVMDSSAYLENDRLYFRHCERSEAIQKNNGLLRRFAPRNDGMKVNCDTLTLSRRNDDLVQ
ncbi:hypothetical protein CCZ01_08445 [Helicobacter monodelphidis]|uniref:hypothetical protein n=1 Tax=Helicobacter sp. 15-1451 TaxID=2004995 RepID=UPI000DCD76CF|nr:hypothetical protein [Helicobacter sp. 15-1451]RAX56801.1 hypothetical protein CCZ01_08445 [Helicobacter sp. 15-1451]